MNDKHQREREVLPEAEL